MRGHVGLAFSLLMLMVFLVFVPDLIVYGTLQSKANAVAEQITREGEIEGGVVSSVENRTQKILEDYGVDNKNFKVTYSKTGTLQQRNRFTVTVTSEYTFRSFNLLGTGLGQFTLPIEAKDSGRSEVWYRN